MKTYLHFMTLTNGRCMNPTWLYRDVLPSEIVYFYWKGYQKTFDKQPIRTKKFHPPSRSNYFEMSLHESTLTEMRKNHQKISSEGSTSLDSMTAWIQAHTKEIFRGGRNHFVRTWIAILALSRGAKGQIISNIAFRSYIAGGGLRGTSPFGPSSAFSLELTERVAAFIKFLFHIEHLRLFSCKFTSDETKK